jgi:hypothetical protein
MMAVNVVGALALATFIADRRPIWRHRKISLLSASPLPSLLAALCLFLIVDAATSSKAECGVDACGMAIMAALFGLAMAVLVYGTSVVITALFLRWTRR